MDHHRGVSSGTQTLGVISKSLFEAHLNNLFAPTPLEVLKLAIYKNNQTDFGFSLSDGVFEKGELLRVVE